MDEYSKARLNRIFQMQTGLCIFCQQPLQDPFDCFNVVAPSGSDLRVVGLCPDCKLHGLKRLVEKANINWNSFTHVVLGGKYPPDVFPELRDNIKNDLSFGVHERLEICVPLDKLDQKLAVHVRQSCHYHPNKNSIFTCVDCGKSMCYDCCNFYYGHEMCHSCFKALYDVDEDSYDDTAIIVEHDWDEADDNYDDDDDYIDPDDRRFNNPAYRLWREACFQRDGGKCQICGVPGAQVHHIVCWTKAPDKRFLVANGKTLCLDCHKQTDNYCNPAQKLGTFGYFRRNVGRSKGYGYIDSPDYIGFGILIVGIISAIFMIVLTIGAKEFRWEGIVSGISMFLLAAFIYMVYRAAKS